MNLTELFENGAYDPSDDKIANKKLKNTRKPILTLNHINKLRKMREFKKLDLQKRKEFWSRMYGAGADEVEPPMF